MKKIKSIMYIIPFEKEINIDKFDSKGNTLLINAIIFNRINIAKILIENRVNIQCMIIN